jgi:chitinase
MGALVEARGLGPQVCRLVNGPANRRQGNDFGNFIIASWEPCRAYQSAVCSTANAGMFEQLIILFKFTEPFLDPPITWAFNGMDASRSAGNVNGKHFIQRYGVCLRPVS